MNFITILIIIFALGIIVSGIMLLNQSAKKFNLSDEQRDKIKKRNKEQDKKDKDGINIQNFTMKNGSNI